MPTYRIYTSEEDYFNIKADHFDISDHEILRLYIEKVCVQAFAKGFWRRIYIFEEDKK